MVVTPSAVPWGPPHYLVLDVETGEADVPSIEAACKRYEAPSNIKDPKKILARVEESHEKIRAKSALLDAAPILCMAARCGPFNVIFNGMDSAEYRVEGFSVVPCGNERQMLVVISDWLNTLTGPETGMVGFNILGFDLPKLRFANLRHRLHLPQILVPRPGEDLSPPVDVMKLFLRYFTSELKGDLFVSLEEVTERLGLPEHKQLVHGSEVPALAKAGRVQEILTYCALDVLATEQAFLLMTNQWNGTGPGVRS